MSKHTHQVFGFDRMQCFIIYECCLFKVSDKKMAIRLIKVLEGTFTRAEGNENISDLTSATTPVKDKVLKILKIDLVYS